MRSPTLAPPPPIPTEACEPPANEPVIKLPTALIKPPLIASCILPNPPAPCTLSNNNLAVRSPTALSNRLPAKPPICVPCTLPIPFGCKLKLSSAFVTPAAKPAAVSLTSSTILPIVF